MNFSKIISNSDIIVLTVFAILCLMSFISWYIIFNQALKVKKQQKLYQDFLEQSNNNDWINSLSNLLKDSSNNFSCIDQILRTTANLQKEIQQYKNHDSRKEILTLHLTQKLDEIRFWLDCGLSPLASIGSSAPFIGLFGTVWGIYHALGNIAASGNAGLNVVAGPIAESLIATAVGLFCAIPAVLAYNYFVRANRLLLQNLRHLSEKIVVYISNQHMKNHA